MSDPHPNSDETAQAHLHSDTIRSDCNKQLARIEAELSRLRSVVYLLVKDKPEMLRLLGQMPPAGGASQP